jgi:hypothetical protein
MSLPNRSNIKLIVGSVLLLSILVGGVIFATKLSPKVASGSKSSDKITAVNEPTKAVFPYLVPKTDPAWEYNSDSTVFDQTKGIIKYKMTLNGTNTTVTISQQKLPEELKPIPNSAKFNAFIIASNVNYSQPVGAGKAYFRVAQQNGAPARGATTVIFATNDVLLFGQSGSILDYDKWSKLLGSMQLTSAR